MIDDLRWADESSLEILDQLAGGLERLPLLFVVLFRSEQAWQPPWWHRRNYHQLHLDALADTATIALLRETLTATTLSPQVEHALLTRSSGNPLFAQELVAALVEAGTLRQDQDGWQLQQAAAVEQIPGSIQRVLLSRIDALPSPARRLWQLPP
ncbi:MAG: hypothetical protein R2932_55150 [Caldilineaceae bacterium]